MVQFAQYGIKDYFFKEVLDFSAHYFGHHDNTLGPFMRDSYQTL